MKLHKSLLFGAEEIQKEYLRLKGCDIMQGYLFSKPISGEEVIKLIKTTNEKE